MKKQPGRVMKSSGFVAALVACTVSLSLATPACALPMADPLDTPKYTGGGGWGSGPGAGDPSLGGSTIPPGGDGRKPKEDERKEKEAERKKKEAGKPVVKSIGKLNVPRHTSTEVFETTRSRAATKPMVSDKTTAARGASAPSSFAR